MKLFIVGVNHNSPLNFKKLIHKLQKLARNKIHPLMVAVEWDASHHAQVKEQRPIFQRMCLDYFLPLVEGDISDVFGQSLGYEGDIHLKIWPQTHTLWLDEGRVVKQELLQTYATDRLTTLKSFMLQRSQKFTSEAALLKFLDMKSLQCASANRKSKDVLREAEWIRKLSGQHCRLGTKGCGIVIIGSSHTNMAFCKELTNIGFEPVIIY